MSRLAGEPQRRYVAGDGGEWVSDCSRIMDQLETRYVAVDS